MSRAEEKPLWAGRERSQLNEVRNKKSPEDCIRRVEETLGRLDILEKELAQVSIELRADMSQLVAAVDKGAAQQEQSSQSLRTSREARDNETKAVRTEMERRAGEKKGENHNAPDNRGVESEGFILSKELPRLSSAAGGIPARRELTNGNGAVANRPEETSDKRSGLKCHDIETAKTPEVQPKLEPTNQLELGEVRQVGMKIVPPEPPLPQRFYEPPSTEQRTGESSGDHKRRFQGQPDGFSKRQKITGKAFHQPNKFPIMRVPEQNRTPTQISGGPQSVSQSPMYDPLYGTSGHLTAGSVQRLQPGFCICNACLSAQRSQMGCSTRRDPPRGNLINPATAPAPWPQQDYNVHTTCPTTQNAAIRYGPNYGSPCGPPGYISSAQYQRTSNMPSMCPQTPNNPMYPRYIGPCCGLPGYSPTAAVQRLQPASNIPSRHSQTPDSQMTDPRTHSRLNPDTYGTEGRDMRSGEPTATNSQQPSQNTSRVVFFHNTTVSDANSIMRGVAPSGSSKTLERRRLEAQARERRRQAQERGQRLNDVAIVTMKAMGHIKKES